MADETEAHDMDSDERAGHAGEQGTAVKPAPPPQKHPQPPLPEQIPLYRVLLHDDDVNDMEYVVRVICKLTPLEVEAAIERMLEAHNTGLALLLVIHKERAELYVEQFASCGLTVTIERDS